MVFPITAVHPESTFEDKFALIRFDKFKKKTMGDGKKTNKLDFSFKKSQTS